MNGDWFDMERRVRSEIRNNVRYEKQNNFTRIHGPALIRAGTLLAAVGIVFLCARFLSV